MDSNTNLQIVYCEKAYTPNVTFNSLGTRSDLNQISAALASTSGLNLTYFVAAAQSAGEASCSTSAEQ